jgi:hypothetical protein
VCGSDCPNQVGPGLDAVMAEIPGRYIKLGRPSPVTEINAPRAER